jgi:glycosyltransferase involved in cell wall biosynthesis
MKGPQFAIKAINLLKSDYPKTKLFMAGKGQEASYPAGLRRLVNQLNLANHVTFLNHRKDIACLLDSADALIHPSILEGWCLVIAEAVYMKKPIICVDTGGAKDQVEKYGGIVLDPPYPSVLTADVVKTSWEENSEYVKRLAEAMKRVIRNPKPLNIPDEDLERLHTEYIYAAYEHVFKWIYSNGDPEAIKDVLRWNFW